MEECGSLGRNGSGVCENVVVKWRVKCNETAGHLHRHAPLLHPSRKCARRRAPQSQLLGWVRIAMAEWEWCLFMEVG